MSNKGKKRKLSIRKIVIFLLLIILVCALGYFAYTKFVSNHNPSEEIKEVDTIKGYDYTLRANATDYYKSLFKELKETLEAKDVDQNKYAELVGQMFVAAFFNLDNKVSKTDIGGVQFVYSDYRSDFEKYASHGMYKTVESNVYGDRKQELPVVSKVEVKLLKNEPFKYGDKTDDDAYHLSFKVYYKEDLGYQTSGELVLIHNGKKLEVAQMTDESSDSEN